MFRRSAMAALLLLLVALPAAAQRHIQVTPFYGFMWPQGELPAQFALDKTDGGSLDLANGEFESRTAMYGATIALQVWKWFSVEGTLVSGTDRFTADRRPEADVKLLAYSAGAAIELPKYWRFEPFLLGGVGIKQYDFDIPDTEVERDVEFNVGAGVNIALTKSFALNLQARDFISDFSSSLYQVPNERQNDLFVAAGITFRFDLAGKESVSAIR